MTTRSFLRCLLLPGCLLLTGCTVDQYARMLIKQDTNYGKINEAMVGSSKQLVERKTISAARRYTMGDGTEIDVWILKAAPKTKHRGTVLILHGLCDSKVTYIRLAQMLTAKGFDAVLPDLRAHGRSTGKFVTYGALEKLDQKHVMDALLEEKVVTEPLFVSGSDLGASAAILYAAADPRVRGVVAVAPSLAMRHTCRRFLNRNAIWPNDKLFDKIIARAEEIGNFKSSEASAIDAIAKVRCPVLLVHGKLDFFVPFDDSQKLFAAAAGPKELELIPWAGHFGVIFAREASIVKNIEKVVSGRLGATTKPAK